jgi:hypothetical protein
MPMSVFVFMSTVWSSTTFMNWSKPRSVPVTCRLVFRTTAHDDAPQHRQQPGRRGSLAAAHTEQQHCRAPRHPRQRGASSARMPQQPLPRSRRHSRDSFLSMNFFSSGGCTLGMVARCCRRGRCCCSRLDHVLPAACTTPDQARKGPHKLNRAMRFVRASKAAAASASRDAGSTSLAQQQLVACVGAMQGRQRVAKGS